MCIRDSFGAGSSTYTILAQFGMTPVANTTVAVRYAYSNDGMPQWWYHDWTHEAPLDHTSDRENWLVSSSEDLSNVTLYWSENDHAVDAFCPHSLCEGNPGEHIMADITIAYWESIWKDAEGVSTATAGDIHESGSIVASGVIPFSGSKSQTYISFASKDRESTLPVELLSFESECDKSDVVLTWTCASEINNDYFILERSTDNETFREISVIDAEGNSNGETNYSFVDQKSVEGIWYYRLSQVDYDGMKNVIDLISVDCYDAEMTAMVIDVYPNPFREDVEVKIDSKSEGKVYFELVDETGRLLYQYEDTKQANQEIYKLHFGDLKPAMYYLRTNLNDENSIIKLIRQ